MAMKKVVKIVKDDKGSLLINEDGTQDYLEGVFAEMAAPKSGYGEKEETEGNDDMLEEYMSKMKVE
jgi:hypothetical protein